MNFFHHAWYGFVLPHYITWTCMSPSHRVTSAIATAYVSCFALLLVSMIAGRLRDLFFQFIVRRADRRIERARVLALRGDASFVASIIAQSRAFAVANRASILAEADRLRSYV